MTIREGTILCLSFGAMTTKRLVTSERARRFHTIFEGVPDDLVPTHLEFYEGRGGRHPLSRKMFETLDSWNSISLGSLSRSRNSIPLHELPDESTRFQLHYKRRIRGTMFLNLGVARPPGFEGREGKIMGNGISAMLELRPLVKYGLFDDAIHLFKNVINYVHASYGSCGLSTYSNLKPVPIEWNGVSIKPYASIGGPVPHCLPRLEAWINVLGREYVEFLGRSNLLALDVYKSWQDDSGRVWIQITERPEQAYLPEVRAHMKQQMDRLDASDVFCREPESSEVQVPGVKQEYRRPNLDWSEIPPCRDPHAVVRDMIRRRRAGS